MPDGIINPNHIYKDKNGDTYKIYQLPSSANNAKVMIHEYTDGKYYLSTVLYWEKIQEALSALGYKEVK